MSICPFCHIEVEALGNDLAFACFDKYPVIDYPSTGMEQPS
jgi:hypothetical protein